MQKGGTRKEGFGRSKGGFTIKSHLRTDAQGLPIAAEITGGEVSDYKSYHRVMAADAPEPKVRIADRGYDFDAVRADIEAEAACRSSRRARTANAASPSATSSTPCANRIERRINKLKNAYRLATRSDKSAQSCLAFIHIVATRLWVKRFVSRA